MSAADFFDGIEVDGSTGVGCWACTHDGVGAFIDDLLRGLARKGPYAKQLGPLVKLSALHRRLCDPVLMEARGLPVYPRKISAFETHCKEHRRGLWADVEAARRS